MLYHSNKIKHFFSNKFQKGSYNFFALLVSFVPTLFFSYNKKFACTSLHKHFTPLLRILSLKTTSAKKYCSNFLNIIGDLAVPSILLNNLS